MNATDPLASAIEEVIKSCFEAVVKEAFAEISVTAEAWLQQSKLLTIGRANYANYIANTVGVFPLFGTSRSTFVDDVYIDVSITTELEHEKYRTTEEVKQALLKQKSGKTVIQDTNLSPLEAIEATDGGFALLGNPGSGKTTAFRHIAISAARGISIRDLKRIPIYLAVRDMSVSQRGIEEAAIQLLDRLDINEPSRVFHGLLKSGNCILLLDGLDETHRDHQIALTSEFTELRAKYQKSIFCISSRPHSLSIGLAGFTKWETLHLSFKSRLSFVKKWFDTVNPGKGNRLLESCSHRPEILDLGSSPLLLSIVCALYNNDLDIPSDPDELYSRCTEGLLGAWDIFRNIARETVLANFSIRKRIILVSWIAAALFERGKIVFSVEDIQESHCLDRASEKMRQDPPSAEELLTSLHNDFGLLIERTPNLYSFSHLTIQEYLVALYVVDNRTESRLISSCIHKRQWSEIICLVAKMLPDADEYMWSIHKLVRLDEEYDIRLLKRVWDTKPICSPDVRRVLSTEFAAKILHIVTERLSLLK